MFSIKVTCIVDFLLSLLKIVINIAKYFLIRDSTIQFLVGLVGFKRKKLFNKNNVCRANQQSDLWC